MLQAVKFITILLLTAISFSLLFTGCSTHKEPEKIVAATPKPKHQPKPKQHEMVTKTLYVIKEIANFKHAEAVKVLSVEGLYATTSKGQILLSDLEEQRSTFRLVISTPAYSQTKILNIKPKYHDGMWLKAGKYHLEVSKKGYKKNIQWIDLHHDMKIEVPLKKLPYALNTKVSWQSNQKSHFMNGAIFQLQEQDALKMTWNEAKKYCSNLEVPLYGFNTKHFTLPNDTDLLAFSHARTVDYPNSLYWSSTTNNDHQNYAKYVNINSGESSWYKRLGKTHVLCTEKIDIDLNLPLLKLAESLLNNRISQFSLDAETSRKRPLKPSIVNSLKMAFFLKYGNPIIQNVHYDKEHKSLQYEIISQHMDTQKRPYFYKEVRITKEDDREIESLKVQLLDPAFEPRINFKVYEGKLIFLGISNLVKNGTSL